MSRTKSGGLAGVVAGRPDMCTVGKEGAGLTYCGYDIHDLADNACFEEVAHLLHHGHLPNGSALADYREKLKSLRFHGHTDVLVHADLRVLAHRRLVGARVRAAGGQQTHPPRGRVHRTRPQALGAVG